LMEGSIQRAFSEGKVTEVIRPLIAPERFGSGIESRETRTSTTFPANSSLRSENFAFPIGPKPGRNSFNRIPLLGSFRNAPPFRNVFKRSLADFAWTD